LSIRRHRPIVIEALLLDPPSKILTQLCPEIRGTHVAERHHPDFDALEPTRFQKFTAPRRTEL
jgi:hypothetical protein